MSRSDARADARFDARFDARPPSAGPTWYKAHGLGNDYLVVEEGSVWTLDPAGVAAVCHRTRGVGSDGIVVLLGGRGPGGGPAGSGPGDAPGRGEGSAGAPDGGPFRLRMFNPDGSEFERSGNGLRVLASHLVRTGRVGVGPPFDVEVGGEGVRMEVHEALPGGVYDVSVEMGRASVAPAAAGLADGALDDAGTLTVEGLGRVALQTVSVGNPHAVVFTEELTGEALHRYGPRLTTHPAFRHGTNVQLARPVGERSVEILIWERGVGPTSASGTSSCAVAVAAVHGGRLPPGEIEVLMEGGTLRVTVSPSLDVVLRGPVQEVSTGELTAGFLEALGGARGRSSG